MSHKHENVISIDMGATNVRVAYITDGRIIKIAKSNTPKGNDVDNGSCFSDKIIRMIHSEFTVDEINNASAIGVSLLGPLDSENGIVINSPNLSAPNVEIKKPLEEEFNLSVYALKDCNCGALGEICFDKNLKNKTFVDISISTGLGSGICSNGKLVMGKNGNAGEIGHLFVDEKYNVKCGCGGLGHWEAYSSGTGLPKFFNEYCRHHSSDISAEISFSNAEFILDCIKKEIDKTDDEIKNQFILNFYDELSIINARGLSSVIAAYSPDVIIFDGAVAQNNYNLLLKGMMKYIDRYLAMPEIRLSNLNGIAPLYGAAYYAVQKFNGCDV